MKVDAKRLPKTLLIEADLFFSYLTGDSLEPFFRTVVDSAKRGATNLLASSEVYDDVISGLRSQGVNLEKVSNFVYDMKKIPHRTIPITVDIAKDALQIYLKHRGSRSLHYFDSYHVATAKNEELLLLTSDKYIIEHAEDLQITALDVKRLTT